MLSLALPAFYICPTFVVNMLYHSSVDRLSGVSGEFEFYNLAITGLVLGTWCVNISHNARLLTYLFYFNSAWSLKWQICKWDFQAKLLQTDAARSVTNGAGKIGQRALREALIRSNFVFDKLLVYWPHTDKALPVQLGPVSSVHKWDCEKVRLVFAEVLM